MTVKRLRELKFIGVDKMGVFVCMPQLGLLGSSDVPLNNGL